MSSGSWEPWDDFTSFSSLSPELSSLRSSMNVLKLVVACGSTSPSSPISVSPTAVKSVTCECVSTLCASISSSFSGSASLGFAGTGGCEKNGGTLDLHTCWSPFLVPTWLYFRLFFPQFLSQASAPGFFPSLTMASSPAVTFAAFDPPRARIGPSPSPPRPPATTLACAGFRPTTNDSYPFFRAFEARRGPCCVWGEVDFPSCDASSPRPQTLGNDGAWHLFTPNGYFFFFFCIQTRGGVRGGSRGGGGGGGGGGRDGGPPGAREETKGPDPEAEEGGARSEGRKE